MILTGISDEAGSDIETQIKAHQQLGWDHIELRLVDDQNITTPALSDEAFNHAWEKIQEANLNVIGFGSAIGNWARNIAGDFSVDVDDLKLTIARMKIMGCKYVRVMAWVGDGATDQHWRDEGVRRIKELAKMATDAGIYLLQENCTGWNSQSSKHIVDFLDAVDHPNVRLLYDIGNVVGHGGEEPWAYYQAVKSYIHYVHIKDVAGPADFTPSEKYSYPGEGTALVEKIVTDFIASGYDGVFSIEPHVAKVIHTGNASASPEMIYDAYLKYGRMAGDILNRAKMAVASQ